MKILSVSGALFAALLFSAWQADIVYNVSASVPVGLYRVVDPHFDEGDLVAVCPEPPSQTRYIAHGFRCNGYAPLLKQVVASAGDAVSVTPKGVRVNGALLDDSRPLPQDRLGNPLTWFIGRDLTHNEVFIVSTQTPHSFDSRYFGPVAANQIVGRVQPLWLF